MNIRYAKPIDKDQVVSVWNYCFEDGEDFVKYYFENVYDENNTIIIEEHDEVLSALQLNKYTIDLRDNKYDVSYVVGVNKLYYYPVIKVVESEPKWLEFAGYVSFIALLVMPLAIDLIGELKWKRSRSTI